MKAISESLTLGAFAKSLGCSAIKAVQTPQKKSWIAVAKTADGSVFVLAFLTKKAVAADKSNIGNWAVWEFVSTKGDKLNGCAPSEWSISDDGWVTV